MEQNNRQPNLVRLSSGPYFLLLASAAIVFCSSVAPRDVNAQSVDRPLTEKQFNDYEQNAADTLTNDDLRYLRDNQIRLPNELSQAQKSGLHGVINEPKTKNDPAARSGQVNYYLDLAVEQTINCAINPQGTNCDMAYK
jgi:hypothetical protein